MTKLFLSLCLLASVVELHRAVRRHNACVEARRLCHRRRCLRTVLVIVVLRVGLRGFAGVDTPKQQTPGFLSSLLEASDCLVFFRWRLIHRAAKSLFLRHLAHTRSEV